MQSDGAATIPTQQTDTMQQSPDSSTSTKGGGGAVSLEGVGGRGLGMAEEQAQREG